MGGQADDQFSGDDDADDRKQNDDPDCDDGCKNRSPSSFFALTLLLPIWLLLIWVMALARSIASRKAVLAPRPAWVVMAWAASPRSVTRVVDPNGLSIILQYI